MPAVSTGSAGGAAAVVGAALLATAVTTGQTDALNMLGSIQAAVAADPNLQALQISASVAATAAAAR